MEASRALSALDGAADLDPPPFRGIVLRVDVDVLPSHQKRDLAALPPDHDWRVAPRAATFFVEGDDQGIYARAAAERENARQIGKMRQKALAEELSRATAEEYQEDVLDHMEHMEVCIADTNPFSRS